MKPFHVLSEAERNQIVKKIHEEYIQEVRKMEHLSDEECRKIAKEVHEAFEEAVAHATKTAEELNRISREKAIAQIEQEKQDQKLLKKMKGSFFKRLFG